MNWKVIKRGLFVTMEGLQKERDKIKCSEQEREEYFQECERRDRIECSNFLFNQCKKLDVIECDDYWAICWERFRVKVFNKIVYKGDHYYSAEYVYDVSEMKHLLVISGVLCAIVINLVLIFFFNL
jgi:hypothetical protein